MLKATIYLSAIHYPRFEVSGAGVYVINNLKDQAKNYCMNIAGKDVLKSTLGLKILFEALQTFEGPRDIVLYTKNNILKDQLLEKRFKWEERNWLRGVKPIENQQIWMNIHDILSNHKLKVSEPIDGIYDLTVRLVKRTLDRFLREKLDKS